MNKSKKKELLKKALGQHHAGNLDSADKIYLKILESDPQDFDANHLHGTVLSQKRQFAQAINFFSIAYESSVVTCELLNNYAIALRNLKAYTESEKLLHESINLNPKFPNTYLNLSNCYISQEKYNKAIDILKKSIELGINIIRCRVEIVSILYSSLRDKYDESTLAILKENMRTLCEQNDANATSKCALIYHNIGETDEALKTFKISEQLSSQAIPSTNILMNTNIEVIKNILKHEYEQLKHIDSDIDGIRNMKITQEFYNKLENLALSDDNNYTVEDYQFISQIHKVKYNKPPPTQVKYLNENLNINTIENEYCSSSPEIVVVDDFLTKEFLHELQVFFRCSNIFKYPYTRGYIGAFLGKGMANRALLEFSQELKQSFPRIFYDYFLSQAWSFKYDSKRDGIGIHADDARVNVNFWITDDSANMDPECGGMIVWKKMPNKNASFHEFNSPDAMEKMKEDVKDTDYIRVPYKSNRVVIFNSKLYHVTDRIDFKDNYIDRRVNVTFLYK